MDGRSRAGPNPGVYRSRRLRQHNSKADGSQAGFTLIELLVVIIIIGILAAIAIPIFMNQRQKAQDGAAKFDLGALARLQEQFLVGEQTYGTIADIEATGLDVRATSGVTLTVVRFDGSNAYCLSSVHAASGETFYWDSQSGGLQAPGSAGCPVTVTGAAGDTITG